MLSRVPEYLLASVIALWMELKELTRLDTAICNKIDRIEFLNILSSAWFSFEPKSVINSNNLRWIDMRSFGFQNVEIELERRRRTVQTRVEMLPSLLNHLYDQFLPENRIKSLATEINNLKVIVNWSLISLIARKCTKLRTFVCTFPDRGEDVFPPEDHITLSSQWNLIIANNANLTSLDVCHVVDPKNVLLLLANNAPQLQTVILCTRNVVMLHYVEPVLLCCRQIRNVSIYQDTCKTSVVDVDVDEGSLHIIMTNICYSSNSDIDQDMALLKNCKLQGFSGDKISCRQLNNVANAYVVPTIPINDQLMEILANHSTLRNVYINSDVVNPCGQLKLLMGNNNHLWKLFIDVNHLTVTNDNLRSMFANNNHTIGCLRVRCSREIDTDTVDAIMHACPQLIVFYHNSDMTSRILQLDAGLGFTGPHGRFRHFVADDEEVLSASDVVVV